MSLEAMSWAWQQPTSSSGQRLVLLALCDHMADHEDHEGLTAWPSVARIAAMCDLSESTVRTHLDALADAGMIVKVERRRRQSGHMGTWLYRVDTSADPSAVVDSPSADLSAVASADPSAVDQRRPIGAHEPLVQNRQLEPCASSTHLDDEFEQFWHAYGRTGPKKKARECWNRAIRKDPPHVILDGLLKWTEYWQQPGAAAVKWPQGWLNEERWRDDPPELARRIGQTRTSSSMDALRRARERNQQ